MKLIRILLFVSFAQFLPCVEFGDWGPVNDANTRHTMTIIILWGYLSFVVTSHGQVKHKVSTVNQLHGQWVKLKQCGNGKYCEMVFRRKNTTFHRMAEQRWTNRFWISTNFLRLLGNICLAIVCFGRFVCHNTKMNTEQCQVGWPAPIKPNK